MDISQKKKEKKIAVDFWISSKARSKLPLFPFRFASVDDQTFATRADRIRLCPRAGKLDLIHSGPLAPTIFGELVRMGMRLYRVI